MGLLEHSHLDETTLVFYYDIVSSERTIASFLLSKESGVHQHVGCTAQ